MLTEAQLAMRRTGIGGSEIAAVAGLDPYRSALDVYLAKVENYNASPTSDMERGIFLEDGLARWFAHRKQRLLREPGTLRHATHPLALCTPDRVSRPIEDEAAPWRDLSIKAPWVHTRSDWGDEYTDEVPRPYLLQVQWELAVLGSLPDDVEPEADVAVLLDGDLAIFIVRADPELQGLLLEEAERFFRDYVEPRRMPPITGSASCTEWLKRKWERDKKPVIQADLAAEVKLLELQEASAVKAQADERRQRAENEVKHLIGDAAGIQGAGGTVTWKSNKNGVRSFRTPKHWRSGT